MTRAIFQNPERKLLGSVIEKLDRIEEFLNNEIFKDGEPILTKEHKDILDQRLANYKLNPKEGRNWESIKDDLDKKYAS